VDALSIALIVAEYPQFVKLRNNFTNPVDIADIFSKGIREREGQDG